MINRKGIESVVQTFKFIDLQSFSQDVNQFIDEVPYSKVDVELDYDACVWADGRAYVLTREQGTELVFKVWYQEPYQAILSPYTPQSLAKRAFVPLQSPKIR